MAARDVALPAAGLRAGHPIRIEVGVADVLFDAHDGRVQHLHELGAAFGEAVLSGLGEKWAGWVQACAFGGHRRIFAQKM